MIFFLSLLHDIGQKKLKLVHSNIQVYLCYFNCEHYGTQKTFENVKVIPLIIWKIQVIESSIPGKIVFQENRKLIECSKRPINIIQKLYGFY